MAHSVIRQPLGYGVESLDVHNDEKGYYEGTVTLSLTIAIFLMISFLIVTM